MIKYNFLINKPWVFYFASFLSYFYNIIIGFLFIVYFLSINFNPMQIGILLAINRISIIIFEIPTGIFADKYGRKMSVLFSFFIFIPSYLFAYFINSFYLFVMVSILWGIAFTFQSGSKESLMINCLNLANNDKKRNKIFTRLSVFGNLGAFFGGLLAALLAYYFIKIIWPVASLINLFIFTLYFFFARDSLIYNQKSVNKFKISSFAKTLFNNIKTILNNNNLLILIIISLLISFVFSVYGLCYPIFFKQTLNVPNYYFGLLGSLVSLLGIIGALFGEKISKKRGYYFSLNSFAILFIILFISFGLSEIFLIALVFYILIEFFSDAWFPIFQSFINKFIPDNIRASILSINSTIQLSSIALGEILAGALLIYIAPNHLIKYIGLLLLAIPFLLYKIKEKPAK